jgi:DNA-binding transcriptional MocR family regulator
MITESLYRKVAEDIKAAIAAGSYPPGSLLPSEAELAERYGLSRGTVRQAFAALRADGVIASRRGAARGGSSSAAPGCSPSASCCRSHAGPARSARSLAVG